MEWIKIEDQLPEEGVQVLTFETFGTIYSVDYLVVTEDPENPYVWACRLYEDWKDVTHWMPLPLEPDNKDVGSKS